MSLWVQEPFLHILFETASALGSVGLSTGIRGADLLMWMGRLEIIAVLVFLSAPLRLLGSGQAPIASADVE